MLRLKGVNDITKSKLANKDVVMRSVDWCEALLLNDCEPDERLDQITREAALLFGVPIAMINLVTTDDVIFKSCVGAAQGTKLKHKQAFCSLAVKTHGPLVVSDTTTDPIFKNYDLVTGPQHIRSYLGQSLKAPDGSIIGTLCLLDTKPRKYTRKQLALLHVMSEMAEEQLAQIFKVLS